MGFLNHQQYQPSRGRSPWPPGLSPQRPGDLDDLELSGGAGVFGGAACLMGMVGWDWGWLVGKPSNLWDKVYEVN